MKSRLNYHQLVSAAKQDPTGYATLENVLGESDMEAFRKKWEKFVLGIRGSWGCL